MKGKLLKIQQLINEINQLKFMHVTGQSFYYKNKKYFSDKSCENEINKSDIDEFNENERLKNKSQNVISFIIHK